MSIKTWKAEFYSEPADSNEAHLKPITHSLKKWKGLLKKILKNIK